LSRGNSFSIVAGKSYAGKKIGVLSLQGDVELHLKALESFGATAMPMKNPSQLRGLDGLVIPGGESTALLRLCEPIGMLPAIAGFAKAGGAVFGTCAGAILLASRVTGPAQDSLGLIDVTIRRNGFGRQIDSLETVGKAKPPLGNSSIPLTFIRAPRITSVGPAVKILATYKREPVLVKQAGILAATFHPELHPDGTVYGYWLDSVKSRGRHV
jgi:pyridoxal 5'-phosphate synthase pdxT subunit